MKNGPGNGITNLRSPIGDGKVANHKSKIGNRKSNLRACPFNFFSASSEPIRSAQGKCRGGTAHADLTPPVRSADAEVTPTLGSADVDAAWASRPLWQGRPARSGRGVPPVRGHGQDGHGTSGGVSATFGASSWGSDDISLLPGPGDTTMAGAGRPRDSGRDAHATSRHVLNQSSAPTAGGTPMDRGRRPTLRASRHGQDGHATRWGATPSGSVKLELTRSVGGGHKKRALAHGYSRLTPSG